LAQELGLRTGVLDALGSQDGVKRYSQLLEAMADVFAACLGGKP